MGILDRIFTILSWTGVVILLLLLYRIAYFYEVTSHQPTHYRLFVIPTVLLFLGGLCYALTGDAGEGNTIRLAGDSLQLTGGIALIGLGMFLLRRMTGGRR
jgi:hypothetical protein